MKCVKLTNGRIIRTMDKNAEKIIKEHGAAYVNKQEWKQAGRQYL